MSRRGVVQSGPEVLLLLLWIVEAKSWVEGDCGTLNTATQHGSTPAVAVAVAVALHPGHAAPPRRSSHSGARNGSRQRKQEGRRRSKARPTARPIRASFETGHAPFRRPGEAADWLLCSHLNVMIQHVVSHRHPAAWTSLIWFVRSDHHTRGKGVS